MLSRFHLIPERYGRTDRQTDRQTDRFAISISRVSMLTRDKNSKDDATMWPSQINDTFLHFDTLLDCDRQTNRQTDKHFDDG